MVAGVGKRVEVSSEDRVELERIVGAASSEVRMVERARIVLCAAEGLTAPAIAERVGCGEKTAKKWRGRYARKGIDGLRDGPRPGPPHRLPEFLPTSLRAIQAGASRAFSFRQTPIGRWSSSSARSAHAH